MVPNFKIARNIGNIAKQTHTSQAFCLTLNRVIRQKENKTKT